MTNELATQQLAELAERGFTPADIANLLQTFAPVVAEKAELAARETRKGVQQRAASLTAPTAEEKAIMSRLSRIIGSSKLSAAERLERPLTQAQIDKGFAELIPVRTVKDRLEGRESAIKEAFRQHVALLHDFDDSESGEVVSTKAGWKVTKTVLEDRAEYREIDVTDFDLLEAVVSPEVWKAITVPARKVDPGKLAEAMAKRKLTTDDLQAVVNGRTMSYLKVTAGQVRMTPRALTADEKRDGA